ncbi:hypothetical protein PAF17_10505 [Paracoccus sp. Z330]|uniref:Uncharacterized protein n=1 Tax=Paracoccus onchidii TaxID=3017813 RepID=A0ABT4ZGT1_9RHOB|nr:hypothetical protein [Paracoccus onchidii]MDB6177931.1 hypothetical protein [Paracoccus onchidii]
MKKVAVEFKRSWSRYNPGEVAGFDEAQADELVKAGHAVRAGKQPMPKMEKLTIAVGDIRETDAFKDAMSEIQGEWQKLEERANQVEAEEKRLEGVRAQLDLQIDASDPGDFCVVDAKDSGDPDNQPDTAAGEPEAKRSGKGGLPKQGR